MNCLGEQNQFETKNHEQPHTIPVTQEIMFMRKNFAAAIFSDTSPGSGEMKQRIRDFDWSKTELGPIENFSFSLLSNISMMLSSNFPISMFWGPSHVLLYNDAFIPICGAKHPTVLGMKGKDAWNEIWEHIQPTLDKALYQGIASYQEDLNLCLRRNGYLEETFFTNSFNPIMDDNGKIGGIFSPGIETTKKVIYERRLQLLREVAAQTNRTLSLNETCTISTNLYEKLQVDIPFALIYLKIDNQLILKSNSGYGETVPSQIPKKIDLTLQFTEQSIESLLQQVARNNQMIQFENPEQYLGQVIPDGYWKEKSNLSLAIPLNVNDKREITGVLVMGTNSRRAFDSDYQTFVELLANQLSKAISTAQMYENEKKNAEEMTKLDEAKTTFFANISHEFRTPLTLILSGLEQLQSAERTPSQIEIISLIERNSKRLLKLVNSLLDFSRIEAGRIDMKFEPIDVVEYTRQLVSLFEPIIKKEGLELEFKAEKINDTVYIDTSMWEKIILNLLSNAFKFTLKGKIQVSLEQIEDTLQVKVCDTGIGIPKNQIPNLFKRFFRIHESKGRSFEGSGIGLALVQELVQYHGGSISVQSEIDQGTCFTLTIPTGSAHLPIEKVTETNSMQNLQYRNLFLEEVSQWNSTVDTNSIATSNKEYFNQHMGSKILVVDDNSDMRKYLYSILSPLFKVDLCSNGQEAFIQASKTFPDLILSDVMMPIIDGFQLIQLLKSNPKTSLIPVILLSARSGDEAKIEGLQKRANDYLVKTSFSAKELITRINTQLELSNLRLKLKHEVEEKSQALVAIAEAKRIQDEFIDTICHEIRNPLSGIQGCSELLQDAINTCTSLLSDSNMHRLKDYFEKNLEMMKSSINNIQECVSHQLMIANDVLSLSKIEAGKFEIQTAKENVSLLVKSTISLFSSHIAEKKIRVESTVDDHLTVEIDGRRYKQILINLLSNALKFSPANGTVWISVEYCRLNNKSGITSKIRDEGCGISSQEQIQLFQRFSQVNRSIGQKYNGFGLGLAICSKLVQLFGGEIEVVSQEGKGAVFSFTIPCFKCNTSLSETSVLSIPNFENRHSLQKPILLVEDNEINQKVMKRILTSKGVICDVACNGEEAVHLFEINKYSLILMDIVMPKMNGIEATRKIREKENHSSVKVPIIGLSGNARQEHQQQAIESGMDDYIIKPVQSQTIFQIIHKWCNGEQ